MAYSGGGTTESGAKHRHLGTKHLHRALSLTAGAAIALATAVVFVPQVATADIRTLPTGAITAGHAHGLYLSLMDDPDLLDLGLDNAEELRLRASGAVAQSAYTSSPGWASGRDIGELDLEALGINVSGLLGLTGINLPLVKQPNDALGLLDLGSLGALSAVSESGTSTSSPNSSAWTGLLSQDGTVNLDPANVQSGDPAALNLSDLLQQTLGQTADTLVSAAELQIGALGSRVTNTNGVLESEYLLADLKANLESPLVGELGNTVTASADGVLESVDGLLAALNLAGLAGLDLTVPDTDIGLEVSGISVDLGGLTAQMQSALTEFVETPLVDSTDLLSVNLADGTVVLNLEELLPSGTLNGLPANTQLLTAEHLGQITTALTEVISGISEKVVDVVAGVLNDTQVNVTAELNAALPLVFSIDAPVSVTLPLSNLLGTTNEAPVVSVPIDLGGVVGLVFELLLESLGLSVAGLESEIQDIVGDAIIATLTTAAEPLATGVLATVTAITGGLQGVLTGTIDGFSPVLDGLVEILAITINMQPTELGDRPIGDRNTAEPGDLGAGSHTTRALEITLLPATPNLLQLQLGSSTALAVPVASITVSPGTVADGEVITITGSGYLPNEPVVLTMPDGTTQEVTATGAGELPAGTEWTVPVATAAGNYTVTGVGQTSDRTGSDTFTVINYNPALVALPNVVQPGASTTITGTGFKPGETITLTLPDGSTAPAITANGSGIFTYQYTVSREAEDGDELEFSAIGADTGKVAETTVLVQVQIDSDLNTNASASAAASARADGDNNPAAQAAAEAAALANASTSVSARSDVTASSAAQAAARADNGAAASSQASANVGVNANAAATAAAQSNATSTAATDANANANASAQASSLAESDNSSAAEAAADAAAMGTPSGSANDRGSSADASAAASANVRANANASASAAASAQADVSADPAAQAAAQAAAFANAMSTAQAAASAAATAAAVAAAEAAAEVAANASAATRAAATSQSDSNASAAVAAQASAMSTSVSAQDANSSASAAANPNAAAAAEAAAESDASVTASAIASTNANASASAAASANASAETEAAAQAAAQAAAYANAQSTASAAARANAIAAAQVAAMSTASSQASTTAQTQVTAAATAAAQASASSVTNAAQNAQSSAAVNANASAAAQAAAIANASTNASTSIAANASSHAAGPPNTADSDNLAAAEPQASPEATAASAGSKLPLGQTGGSPQLAIGLLMMLLVAVGSGVMIHQQIRKRSQ